MPHPTHWFVILNPTAGSGRAGRHGLAFFEKLQGLGMEAELHRTQRTGHAEILATEALRGGWRNIMVIGGDGTYGEVVNGVLGAKQEHAQLAFVAAGTANDYHRSLGRSLSPGALKAAIDEDRVRVLDVGRAVYQTVNGPTSRYFLNVAGLGFDSYILQHYLTKNPNVGSWAYLNALVRGLFRYELPHLSVKTKTQSFAGRGFILAAGVGKYFGGGMMIAPDAEPDDGLFDFTFVRDLTKSGVLRRLPKLYRGTFLPDAKIDSFRGAWAEVKADVPVYLQLDGELAGRAPVRFEIVPKAIRVIG